VCTAVVFIEFVKNGLNDEMYLILIWGSAVLEWWLLAFEVLSHPHYGIPVLEFASPSIINFAHIFINLRSSRYKLYYYLVVCIDEMKKYKVLLITPLNIGH
jgi:hypothetical protein